MLAVAGVTATDSTGTGSSEKTDVPLWPSLVAVIVTGPPAILPVTRPFGSTVAGVTLTEATGTRVETVTFAVPLLPSLVAVIVTGPPVILPVTRPFGSTVAMVASLVAHVTVRPVSGLPFASFGVAVSCTVAPTAMFAVAGVTPTDATGTGVAAMASAPPLPSPLAAVVATPPATFPPATPQI